MCSLPFIRTGLYGLCNGQVAGILTQCYREPRDKILAVDNREPQAHVSLAPGARPKVRQTVRTGRNRLGFNHGGTLSR